MKIDAGKYLTALEDKTAHHLADLEDLIDHGQRLDADRVLTEVRRFLPGAKRDYGTLSGQLYQWYFKQTQKAGPEGHPDLNLRTTVRRLANELAALEAAGSPQNLVEEEAYFHRLAAKGKQQIEHLARLVESAAGRARVDSDALIVRASGLSDEGMPTFVEVVLLTPSSAQRLTEAPTFTLIGEQDGKVTVDDQIEGGDYDFFGTTTETNDYFKLIKELTDPGSTLKKGNKLTLYTARPREDRAHYLADSTIYPGVFLTTSESEAFGLAEDLGGVRDVWKVRILDTDLIVTLESGRHRHYQVIGDAPVPATMTLIS